MSAVWLKLAPYLLAFAVGLALAGGIVYKVKQSEIDVLNIRLQVSEEANKVNTETIAALKQDLTNATKSCDKRIAVKDSLLRKFKEIDSANETTTGTDDILSRLNGMFSPGEDGISEATDP